MLSSDDASAVESVGAGVLEHSASEILTPSLYRPLSIIEAAQGGAGPNQLPTTHARFFIMICQKR